MKKSINIVGFIAALLMFVTVIMKTNHLPGAGIAMVLAGLALSIYLPFFLLYKPGEASNAGTNTVSWVGAISASIINLSITFKFQHWPGAAILLTLGLVCFALVFIPMLLRRRLKEEKGSERKVIMNMFGATGLTLFSLGVLFKIMHWPGAMIMLGLSVFFLFFGYFLMYMLDRSINAEAKTAYLRKAFLSVIIGCVVTSLLMVALSTPQTAPQQEIAATEHQ